MTRFKRAVNFLLLLNVVESMVFHLIKDMTVRQGLNGLSNFPLLLTKSLVHSFGNFYIVHHRP